MEDFCRQFVDENKSPTFVMESKRKNLALIKNVNTNELHLYAPQGFEIDSIDEYGITPLMDACIEDEYHMTRLLLKKNPDINLQDKDGLTAIMHAVDGGHHRVAQLVLGKHPDLSITDNRGYTACMLAIENGDNDMVGILLDHVNHLYTSSKNESRRSLPGSKLLPPRQ